MCVWVSLTLNVDHVCVRAGVNVNVNVLILSVTMRVLA